MSVTTKGLERGSLDSKTLWPGNGERLRCPTCGAVELSVAETRYHAGAVRRIRRCANGHRFFTAEMVCDIHCQPIQQNMG